MANLSLPLKCSTATAVPYEYQQMIFQNTCIVLPQMSQDEYILPLLWFSCSLTSCAPAEANVFIFSSQGVEEPLRICLQFGVLDYTSLLEKQHFLQRYQEKGF